MKVPWTNWKSQLGFGVALVALLAVGAISYRARMLSIERDQWVRHTHEVIESLLDLSVGFKTIESSTRAYVITGTPAYAETVRTAVTRAQDIKTTFRDLTVDNPNQQRLVPVLDGLLARLTQRAQTMIALRGTAGLDATADAIRGGPGQSIADQFEGAIRQGRDEERRLLTIRRAASDRQSSLAGGLVVLGTLIGGMVTGVAGWSVQRDHTRRRLAEDARREGDERFRDMADNISQLAWMADATGRIFWYNRRWYEFTGSTPEAMAVSGWNTVHPDHLARVKQKIRACFRAGEDWEDTYPLRGKDGNYHWFLSRAVPIRDAKGMVLRWFGTNTDVTEIKLLEDALFKERELAEVTLKSIGDAVVCADVSGNVSFINTVAEKLTGWSSQAANGATMGDVLRIIDAATRETIVNPMEIAASENRSVTLPPNCVLIRRDGFETPIEDVASPIHDRDGKVAGAVIVFRDVTTARAMAAQMAHAAQHDFLTGLPNRMLLGDRIGQAIALSSRRQKRVAVLFIDLDGFKQINDSLGHEVGDKLLQSVAGRLSGCVRSSDTISRQGGDEFIALLAEVERAEDAAASATRMLRAVAAPHEIDGQILHVTTSIGVAIYPEDGVDVPSLIKHADAAMYQAKNNGKQSVELFQPFENAVAAQ